MNIIFYNRDFTNKITLPPSVQIVPTRYTKHMKGGCKAAYLSVRKGARDWDLRKFLRCPVEIWDNGKPLWWGFVNSVMTPIGSEQRFGRSLDEMYNHVTVAYESGDTSAASDAVSVSEYGQKEIRINGYNSTQTEAEQTRDVYLEDHSEPIAGTDFSGGQEDVELVCYGWFSTLGWSYYSDSDTTNTDNATQIYNIVDGVGQFFAGIVLEDTAGITSNENRSGTQTALTYVNQLLDAGTSNTRPLLATVDSDRYLHVYERKAKPPTNDPDYLLRNDGRLLTPLGKIVPDKECKVAVWTKLKDVPDADGLPFFIESAEYDVEANRTVYKLANAYEQSRLSKYVAESVTGVSSGSGGTIAPPVFATPLADPAAADFGLYVINDTLVANDNVDFSSTLGSRGASFTVSYAGSYATIKFLKTGLYYAYTSCTLVGDDAGPDDLQFYILNQSSYSYIVGNNVIEHGSTDQSVINFGGFMYVKNSASGTHPRVGLTYALLTEYAGTIVSASWDIYGWLGVVRIG